MPNPLHDPRYAILRQTLVRLREAAGMTQVEVGQRLGKPQSYVSKYELGERRLDVVECIRIAEAMGIAPGNLLQRIVRDIDRQNTAVDSSKRRPAKSR